jgi:hypothetical protein
MNLTNFMLLTVYLWSLNAPWWNDLAGYGMKFVVLFRDNHSESQHIKQQAEKVHKGSGTYRVFRHEPQIRLQAAQLTNDALMDAQYWFCKTEGMLQ